MVTHPAAFTNSGIFYSCYVANYLAISQCWVAGEVGYSATIHVCLVFIKCTVDNSWIAIYVA